MNADCNIKFIWVIFVLFYVYYKNIFNIDGKFCLLYTMLLYTMLIVNYGISKCLT